MQVDADMTLGQVVAAAYQNLNMQDKPFYPVKDIVFIESGEKCLRSAQTTLATLEKRGHILQGNLPSFRLLLNNLNPTLSLLN